MNLSEKTILVTGATDGVGRRVARDLAACGAHVIVHGRNPQRGTEVVEELRQAGGREPEFHRADFSSLDDVRLLAEALLAQLDRLDVLVNNAGIGYGPPGGQRETSRDGHELRFAVNYLAPFLLTHLLLPLLQRSAPARIVDVASIGQAPIDFGDLMLTRGYDGTQAYRRSKLALVMFTFDLANELGGTGVTANCVHPATYMDTKMVHEFGGSPQSTVADGAEAIEHLVMSDDVKDKSGLFFNRLRPARAEDQAYDESARQRLHDVSCGLAGLDGPKDGTGATRHQPMLKS